MLRPDMSDEEMLHMAKEMAKADRLSPSIIMSSLCGGHLQFFEACLAQKAGIPIKNARRLSSDRGQLGFDALYKKTGLPESMFEATKALLKVVQEIYAQELHNQGAITNRIAERLLQYADGKHIENISYVLALVRQSRR